MQTKISIEGTRFLINGESTYDGLSYNGHSLEGLLFNSRMVQAIFDDLNPGTVEQWKYPDTEVWSPDRNTDEFCAALESYRKHGLLAVTVGLQGGGSIYDPEIYDNYDNSAFSPDGSLREAYFERLERILGKADELGMVVIVNYFYFKQAQRIHTQEDAKAITRKVTERLLATGYENILVDLFNETHERWGLMDIFNPPQIHQLIEIVQGTSLEGRRLLVGTSSMGGDCLPLGKWAEIEDFHLPHGNDCDPVMFRSKLRRLKESTHFRNQPKPILCNEDSTNINNLMVATEEGASWGFYSQGYGSGYDQPGETNWSAKERERTFEQLTGFQTVPVNWSINSDEKKAFFGLLKDILGKQSAAY